MNLSRFPRRRYADGPTPLQPLARLSEALGVPNLFIKRDDLLGFGGGGNKIRKLEFVVADALVQGADYLVTCGAVQSNDCRLTLAAAGLINLTTTSVTSSSWGDPPRKSWTASITADWM